MSVLARSYQVTRVIRRICETGYFDRNIISNFPKAFFDLNIWHFFAIPYSLKIAFKLKYHLSNVNYWNESWIVKTCLSTSPTHSLFTSRSLQWSWHLCKSSSQEVTVATTAYVLNHYWTIDRSLYSNSITIRNNNNDYFTHFNCHPFKDPFQCNSTYNVDLHTIELDRRLINYLAGEVEGGYSCSQLWSDHHSFKFRQCQS